MRRCFNRQGFATLAAILLAPAIPSPTIAQSAYDWRGILLEDLEPSGKVELGGYFATDGGTSLSLQFTHENFLSSGNSILAKLEGSDTTYSGALELNLGRSAIPGTQQSVLLMHRWFEASRLRDLDVEQSLLRTTFAFKPNESTEVLAAIEAGWIDATAHGGTAPRLAEEAGQRSRLSLGARWTEEQSPHSWLEWRLGLAPKFVWISDYAAMAQIEAAADLRVTSAHMGSRLDISMRSGLAEAFGDGRTHFLSRYFLEREQVRGFEPGGLGPRQNGDAIGGERYSLLRVDFIQPVVTAGPLQSIEIGLFADIGSLWEVNGHAAGLDDSLFWRQSEGAFLQMKAGAAELRVTFPRVSRSLDGDRTRDVEISLNARF